MCGQEDNPKKRWLAPVLEQAREEVAARPSWLRPPIDNLPSPRREKTPVKRKGYTIPNNYFSQS